MMTDTLTTRNGELHSGHVGRVHVERTANGVEIEFVGAVTPTTRLTVAEAHRLARVLTAAV